MRKYVVSQDMYHDSLIQFNRTFVIKIFICKINSVISIFLLHVLFGIRGGVYISD